MADVTVKYKDTAIAELSDSGTKTLKTAGKYCEDDINVEYAKPTGGGGGGEMFSSSASGWTLESQVGRAVSVLGVVTDVFTSSAIGSLTEQTA